MGCGCSNKMQPAHESASRNEYCGSPREIWQAVRLQFDKLKRVRQQPIKGARRVIHLYVSSMFNDFDHERHLLATKVFPELQRWCSAHKLLLVTIDMRHGLTTLPSTKQFVELCMNELQRSGDSPLFLSLLTNRNNFGWIPDDCRLPGWIEGLSLVENEIVMAAGKTVNPSACFCIRLAAMGSSSNSFSQSVISNYSQSVISILHEMYPDQVIHYQEPVRCTTCGKAAHMSGDYSNPTNELVHLVMEFFTQRIKQFYLPVKVNTSLLQIQMDQDQHADQNQLLVGREQVVAKVMSYIKDHNPDTHPLIIVGEPSSGRSVVIAMVTCDGFSDDNVVVFHHTVSPWLRRSCDLRYMLYRLWHIKGLGQPRSHDPPIDVDGLSLAVHKLLSRSHDQQAVIFIDNLDRVQGEPSLAWLPWKLAGNVKVVISLSPSSEWYKLICTNHNPVEVVLPLLSYDEKCILISHWLSVTPSNWSTQSLASKKASNNMHYLWEVCHLEGAPPPDLLSLYDAMISQLEDLVTDERVAMAILCLLECSRAGLQETELLWLLNMLLVQSDVTSCCTCSHGDVTPKNTTPSGISSCYSIEDLEHVSANLLHLPNVDATKLRRLSGGSWSLSSSGGNRTPESPLPSQPAKWLPCLPYYWWSVIHHSAHQYLRCYHDNGRIVICQRNFSKAIRKRYMKQLPSNLFPYKRECYPALRGLTNQITGARVWWCSILAAYFEQCPNKERRAEELPYYLYCCHDYNRLVSVLCEVEVFRHLSQPDQVIDLLHYWNCVGGATMAARSYHRELTQIQHGGASWQEAVGMMRHVAKFLYEAGQVENAQLILVEAIEQAEQHLSGRTSEMAELTFMMTCYLSNSIEQHCHRSPRQLMETEYRVLQYASRSIQYHRNLGNSEQLATLLLLMGKHLLNYCNKGGSHELTASSAQEQAQEAAHEATELFQSLGKPAKLLDAMLVKALALGNSPHEMEIVLKEGRVICRQHYGNINDIMLQFELLLGQLYGNQLNQFDEALHHYMNWINLFECLEGNKQLAARQQLSRSLEQIGFHYEASKLLK